MYAIDVVHARKRFGRVEALADITLRVPAGSVFGFLGPNGAGKTTTLRGLVGLLRFDAGTARVLGKDPWSDRVEVHEHIGYLPGDMGMYPRMRGIDVLDYAASLTRGSGRSSPLRARVLDALQLSDRDLRRPVRDYSKGMRQKVAITQAMQHDPQLLMMDEPSEGLDPLVQHAVYELVRERAAAGRTVLFSSHTLSEVEALCDRVAIIRAGRLVVEGPLDELRTARPRVVRVSVSDPHQLEELDQARFVRQPNDHAGRAVFHVTSPPDELIAALGALSLQDVLVEEPSLEDIFRSYYEGSD